MTQDQLALLVEEVLEEVLEERKKKRKKKKKSSGKKDACYHKVKRRYKVWPSAYASGALVKCRKVGAKNWGKSTNEELALDEEELQEILAEEDEETLEEKKRKKRKKRKLTKKPSSETNLGDWFKRKGAKGSSGGWVDCNAPDGKGGYKTCGRKKGEKRSKYPACRPTPSACKSKGKGKKWGKKGSKRKNESMENIQDQILQEVMQIFQSTNISEGLQYHLDNKIPLTEIVYRPSSDAFTQLLREARNLHSLGLYEALTEDEEELLEGDLGEYGYYEGQLVELDRPMLEEEDLDEAKYKGKEVSLGKPTKGDVKKYKVYVRNKNGKVIKVNYGSKDMKGNWNDPKARKSFAARHKCAQKKDKTKPGYWACRAHKHFGKNVSGVYW